MTEPTEFERLMYRINGKLHEDGFDVARDVAETVQLHYQPLVEENSVLRERLRGQRAATVRAWNMLLGYMLDDRLDDGTPVLELVFVMNPELRHRLSAYFGGS